MILKVIFVQRKCRYDGEFAPEAMECMTEYAYEDNPEWIENKLTLYKKNDEFTSAEIIDINIDENKVLGILFPAKDPINGKI